METEVDLLGLPDVPRIVLDHPPLVLTVCQVRFNSVLGVADPKIVAPFQRAIQQSYPLVNQVQNIDIVAQPGNEAAMKLARPGYQFSDQNDIWRLVLTQDALALETRTYEDFESFLDRLQKALDALIEHIQPAFGARLGLRYINELRPDGMVWASVIRPELLGPIGVPEFIENATQIAAIQQLSLRYPNNQGITIHHGFVPGGTTVRPRQGEEIQNGEFYLLDYDAFREFPASQGLLMDTETICRHVKTYHQMIYRLFRWSVTDEYLAMLRR
ncbi:MAG TPA: TIGR04255 family protein [Ktedonobacteraceae bacterium]|nr:TIGR04255 family protein [Ktedonobacteraceae bacterium]